MSGIARRGDPRSDELTLIANGRAISGWTSVRVQRSIERMPAAFEISMTDLDPGTPVREGDAVQVKLGGDLVLTGYADAVERGFDEGGNAVTVTGRSKSQDLVDCSAEWDGCQISGASALKIAQTLAAPYGIKVAGVGDPGRVIPTFNFALTDTAINIIELVLRYTGKLAYDRPDGSVVIGDVGTQRMASGFAEGVNVQSARVTRSVNQRFQTYRLVMTAMDVFEDVGDGGNLISTESDPNVRRHRLKYFVAESGDSSFETSKLRLKWEAARRAGRGQMVRLTADNWRDSADKLWEPNYLVNVKLPSLKLPSAELLISEVAYRRDAERGTTADLVLMPPAAFKPQPIILQPAINLSEIKR